MSCDFSEANLRRILSEDCKYEHVHTESGDFLGDFIEVDFDNSPTINSITEEKILSF